jgi:ribosomal protein L29
MRVFGINVKELRGLSDTALKTRADELALELSIERRKIASTGVSSKVIKVRSIKRTIAKINTVLSERGAKG